MYGHALLSSPQVTVTPRMSSNLTFSASYLTDHSKSRSANCSLLSGMQYNCTAEFPIGSIESVNVTVSGPYGSSASFLNTTGLG